MAQEDLGLHHYRVSVVLVGLNSYTVVANSPQEAQEKVMAGQGGRSAGSEGPVDFMALVHDRSEIDPQGPPTLDKVLNSLQHAVTLQAKVRQAELKRQNIQDLKSTLGREG
jgi:hypothetical protein